MLVAQCPSCHAWSLQQLLNPEYMQCLHCDKTFKLVKVDIAACERCEMIKHGGT